MRSKQVAVLRGGISHEHSVSMLSGAAVLEALTDSCYVPRDIVIAKNGDWLFEGEVVTQTKALRGIDVVFVALHGEYGEDGQVQSILEDLSLPFTGSGSIASAKAFNKEITKNLLLDENINLAKHCVVKKIDSANLVDKTVEIINQLGTSVFIKPVANGSSFGARLVTDPGLLHDALKELLATFDELLIEEYIKGVEATLGVLDNFKNEELYALPAVEIIPPADHEFFTTHNKYDGSTTELVPGRFGPEIVEEMARVAKLAHATLDCSQYSRSDFLIKDSRAYFLEINTLPGLTAESLFPKSTAAVGLSFKDLISHLIETAVV